MIKIGVPGITGRMGAAVAQQVLAAPDMQLAIVAAREGNAAVGTKFAASDLTIASTIQVSNCDVLIDFTLPGGVMQHLDYCQHHNIAMVIGTTGFSDPELQAIQLAAKRIPILLSANMSIGVNICFKILAFAASLMDNSWQIDVQDVHHKHKKDSPSGTAIKISAILAEATQRPLADIKINSKREGETIGEHIITFDNRSETIALSHVAQTRDIYAQGAIAAARWIYAKPAGLYSMQDMIES